MLAQGARRVQEVGPALSAVARAAVALARVGALLDRDAIWMPAWLDRLQALETAAATALEFGGAVLIDDVRDVDHNMAAGGARTLAIDGLRKMWRSEGAVPTCNLDGDAVFAALGRRTHVLARRYLGPSTPAPGAWRTVTPDPAAVAFS